MALHDLFGNKLYWEARRSMRFNKDLKNIAAEFRELHLNSNDENDNTFLPKSWNDEKVVDLFVNFAMILILFDYSQEGMH